MGISTLELTEPKFDQLKTDKLNLSQLQTDKLKFGATEIKYLRRGLIGVNKIGYV